MATLADMKITLVLAIVIVYHVKKTTSLDTPKCNPQEICLTPRISDSPRIGESVPNPLDKDSYFICLEDAEGTIMPSDAPIKCPPGNTFTPYHGGYCAKSDEIDKTSCINMCDGECNNYHHERIANMNDCSSFYTCLPGNKKVETKCPPDDPYFDGNRCQKSKYLCCTCCDECSTYCHKENIQIADPFDCKSFYHCNTEGYPEPENRHQCEEGRYFNKSKGRCEDEDKNNPCVPSCKNETISSSEKRVDGFYS